MNKSQHAYVVHKFGGTSLADAERFKAIKPLLKGHQEVIVVSATKETTSTLQQLLDQAKNGAAFLPLLTYLEQKHLTLIEHLLSDRDALISALQKDFQEIKDILHAVQLTTYYSKETQDLVLGYGEIWSGKILTAYLCQHHQVRYLDASTVLYCYEKNGSICIDWQKSQTAFNQFIAQQPFEQLVITGYIAATLEGRRTTLGRNGSDFSAAIFAHLIHATALTIWTDVDGIYTADPQKVRAAFVIDTLSYKEALELAYFGAKVLHPMTIAPVLKDGIPIYIKNSFNPAAKGTYISAESAPSPYLIKGLTSIDPVALINIEGSGMIGVSGMAARVFDILHQANISVILISQASSEHSICFAIAHQQADLAKQTLTEQLQFELDRQQIEAIHIDRDCAILAAVGDQMVGAIGISGKLCATLAKANVNIRAISQGSSERNLSVVIKRADVTKALQAVHARFYLSHKTIAIGLIGPGQVGKTLLQQIHVAREMLQNKYQVNLYVRGLMNSQKMLLSHHAIDLQHWQSAFEQCQVKADIDTFATHLLTEDIPYAVIIDCTANQAIAKHYLNFLEKGIHVITPNKHANAGDFAYYQALRAIQQIKQSHYLYEATVCAGLPVINTLQDLIKTGDDVIKLEGVVSGTLSFIFNELAKGRLFSEVVYEAKQKGFTEPDPREDLSGMDVARKLVCLAREIGHSVSLSNVKVEDLVPAALKTVDVETFLTKLPQYDDALAVMLAKANAQQQRLCYIGTIHPDGRIQVAIEARPSTHPFARLQGTDNMLIFHTRRYHTQPLIIQGPGAGAEVTAAGIFTDLLRLVSFLS